MEWTDEGIVLGTRKHGEANTILELMTREHGRHLGLVRGGAGSRLRPVLQPGNSVGVTWRARIDEHLGHYAVEGLDLRAASFLSYAHAVYGITYLAALCRLLPERDPHPEVFAELVAMVDRIGDRVQAAALVARFELSLLADLGFGLDLAECAATGAVSELVYVSPKSGRAVSRSAGEPWRDKLLQLPEFLSQPGGPLELAADELAAAFALTGFFLARDVFEPRGLPLPESRQHFLSAALSPRPARSREHDPEKGTPVFGKDHTPPKD
jgi:DNA repair protein RecO (recombination protein O)